MAYRKKKMMRRKRSRKITRRKRMMRSANKSFWGSVVADKSPLPKTFKTTLRYMDAGGSINNAVGGLADSYVYSANSVYDPNISGTGHQPVGFDQLMTMYTHFTVIASKVRVSFTNTDSSNFQTVGIYLSANSTEQVDYRVIVENGGCKYAILDPKNGSSKSSVTLTSQCAPLKWLGKGKGGLFDDQVRGSASANPSEMCYWHIFANDYSNTSDVAAVNFQIQIDYVVVFSEPKELALS